MANSATEADINAWNMQTEQACMGSLMNLKGLASNQAGMAVCYNLPFLDPATGVFEAELRMFNVSPPINEWVGVAPQDIMVTLSYLGATVQKANGALQRRAVDDLSKLVERQTTMPQQLKVLTYVGQINSNLRGSQMNLYVHLLHMTMLADTRRAGRSYSRCLSHKSTSRRTIGQQTLPSTRHSHRLRPHSSTACLRRREQRPSALKRQLQHPLQ